LGQRTKIVLIRTAPVRPVIVADMFLRQLQDRVSKKLSLVNFAENIGMMNTRSHTVKGNQWDKNSGISSL